jgi:hypothetical protein
VLTDGRRGPADRRAAATITSSPLATPNSPFLFSRTRHLIIEVSREKRKSSRRLIRTKLDQKVTFRTVARFHLFLYVLGVGLDQSPTLLLIIMGYLAFFLQTPVRGLPFA